MLETFSIFFFESSPSQFKKNLESAVPSNVRKGVSVYKICPLIVGNSSNKSMTGRHYEDKTNSKREFCNFLVLTLPAVFNILSNNLKNKAELESEATIFCLISFIQVLILLCGYLPQYYI